MSTCSRRTASHQPQNHWAKPTVEQLFGYAAEQIEIAASETWPGEWLRLAEHVPSVTGFGGRVSPRSVVHRDGAGRFVDATAVR